MRQIITKEHEMFGKVRVVHREDGEVWFFASDVAKALGYERPNDAVREHCDKSENINDYRYGKTTPPIIIDEFGKQFNPAQIPKIIPESDVYALIMASKLEGARRFKRWVCEEVLPSIRKHGYYVAKPNDFDLFPNLLPAHSAAMELARRHGYTGNHAVLTADKMLKRKYDIDIPELMGGTNLVSRKNEALMTPTELGETIDQSARSINTALEGMGYQKKSYRSSTGKSGRQKWRWVITNFGKEHGEYLDTGKMHSDGTPVQQIKWYESTADTVRDYILNN